MRENPITTACLNCGDPITLLPSQRTRGRGRFCSRSCGQQHRFGTAESRYWSKVVKTDGCWTWTGAILTSGYGVFTGSGKRWAAHRFSWTLHHGPIPDGLWVLHRCDNRQCTNPDHLFLGTQQDNVDDMIAKWRHAHGEQHHQSKVSEADVIAMRTDRAAGMTLTALAEKYGLSIATTQKIVERLLWTHI